MTCFEWPASHYQWLPFMMMCHDFLWSCGGRRKKKERSSSCTFPRRLDCDRLQLRQVLVAPVFKPGRELDALTQLVWCFVDIETDVAGSDFEENASRHAEIDGVEVVTVLLLRDICITEPFQVVLDLLLLCIGGSSKGNVMDGPGTKRPAPC